MRRFGRRIPSRNDLSIEITIYNCLSIPGGDCLKTGMRARCQAGLCHIIGDQETAAAIFAFYGG